MRNILVALAALLAPLPATAQQQVYTVTSPDGTNSLTLGVSGGTVIYTISRRGEMVIEHSPIVLDLDTSALGYGMALTGQETSSADAKYPIVVGKAAEGRDHYNQLIVHFEERGGQKRKMDVVARAYDDGVAFRTLVPVQPTTSAWSK